MRSKLICQTHNDDGESLSVYSMWCMCGSCEDLRIEYRHDGITETLEAFSVPDDLRGFAVWWLAHDLARVTAERDRLREALELLVGAADALADTCNASAAGNAINAARAALNGEGDHG